MPQKHLRIDDDLALDIQTIAKKKKMTDNAVILEALKFYRDYIYMGEQATIINQEILAMVEANMRLAEHRINNKTNQVLSALAIQAGIQNQILAASLEVDPLLLTEYRRIAAEFLKANQRVLRLDELEDSE